MSKTLQHKLRTCNNCPNRSVFNMEADGKHYSFPWCKEVMGYIKFNTYFRNCSYNKAAINEYNNIVENVFRRFWRWITLQSKEPAL